MFKKHSSTYSAKFILYFDYRVFYKKYSKIRKPMTTNILVVNKHKQKKGNINTSHHSITLSY